MTTEELKEKHASITFHDEVFTAQINKHWELSIEYAISVLDEVFGDGLGNIDDNCSKDDLIEQYKEINERLFKELYK